jgi:predicted transcriptional regulator
MAKILNTNQSQYGKYENGNTSLGLEKAEKLSDFFGVSVAFLLGIDSRPTRDPSKLTPSAIFDSIWGKDITEITKWTPKNESVAYIKEWLINTDVNTVTALIKPWFDEKTSPVIVKALAKTIKESVGAFVVNINQSSKKNSDYHFVWEEWTKDPNYGPNKREAEKSNQKNNNN